MEHLHLITLILILLFYGIINATVRSQNNEHHLITEPEIDNIYFQQSSPLITTVNKCDTLIIFDLSRNIVAYEIFDISVRIFLKNILQYCIGFRYVIIDDKFNGCMNPNECNITLYNCDNSTGCEITVNAMNYYSMTSMYSIELYDNNLNDSTSFGNFLQKTLMDHHIQCNQNSAVLLTNRIIDLNIDIIQAIEKANIRLTTILLGRNEINATEFLQNAYENIPNVTTLSLPNYDCLSYLFYCIMPCSNDKPECMQVDIDDCQTPSKWTPNPNPEETLHIWYVMDFIYNPLDYDALYNRTYNGLKNFTETYDIKKVRIRYVMNATGISTSYEDIRSVYSVRVIYLTTTGDVVNDYGHFNGYLNFIPWSGTLTKARIGFLSIIILTNYASMNLITEKDGQKLQGQMFIYNQRGFEYYSRVIKNDTNFQFSPLNYSDSYSIFPITNENNVATTSNTLTTTALTASAPLTNAQSTDNDFTTSTLYTSTILIDQKKSSNNSATIFIICGIICGVLIIAFAVLFIYCKNRQRVSREVRQKVLVKEPSFHVDEWELTWDKLVVLNEIGSGAYGQILLGKYRNATNAVNDVTEVAIKMPGKLATDAVKEQFLNEIYLMKKINQNPNIIKMYRCITAGDRICLILEYCPHGDLLKYAQKLKNDLVNEQSVQKEFFKFLWQMSYGLQYLAEKRIVHRDLAARNILIDSNKNAKITDFGLSIQLRNKTYIIPPRINEKLPIKWLAIESFKSYMFSLKTDIWTFAIVLYEMYSFGKPPYADVEETHLLRYLENNKRLQKPDCCPDEIYEIMLKCWMENPFKRPKIDELIALFSLLQQHHNRHKKVGIQNKIIASKSI